MLQAKAVKKLMMQDYQAIRRSISTFLKAGLVMKMMKECLKWQSMTKKTHPE
jgi:hypothetical protein